MLYTKSMVVVATLLLLGGCQIWTPVGGDSPRASGIEQLEQALAEMPAAPSATLAQPPQDVMQALLPPLSLQSLLEPTEQRFDITVDGSTARDFFMGLVQGTPYNMVVSAEIQGQITLDLKNVTVVEVMNTVRQVYGYEYRRLGNLFQVIPARLETAIFQMNYLHVKREGSSDTQVSAGTVSDAGSSGGDSSSSSGSRGSSGGTGVIGSRISTSSSTDFWGQLQATLSTILGDGNGRRVVITPQAGVIVARGLPSELDTVRDYLQQAELTLQRQVILEAKVLEVELSNGFQSGINWETLSDVNGIGGDSGTLVTSLGSTAVTNAGGFGGVLGLQADFKGFDALIQLLQTQGDVQVLSSPRVSTLNNQKAVIKVGTDEFFVTDVSTTTTTGTSTTTTPDVELTPFFSGIALDVTPQISDEGTIILHIHPTISQVIDQQKVINVGSSSFQLPLAFSTIRESDSVVRASSGQVIVIGGLMKSASTDKEARVPGLGDLASVGDLFQQKRKSSSKSELVILLKPTIADDAAWRRTLQNSLNRFNSLSGAGQ